MTVVEDEFDRRLVLSATGALKEFNDAGVLSAADVHVAQRLARLGDEHDERVLLAAALVVRAVRSGSVCLDLATVREIDPALPWPDHDAWLEALSDSELVGDGRVLVWDGALLYLDRYWQEEGQVCADLLARRATVAPVLDEAALTAALAEYFPTSGYDDQRAAVETACRHWTTVITGGPGTGKTTTIARLLGVLSEISDQPLRIALAAPTGKASARMAQAVRAAVHHESFPAAHRAQLGGLEGVTMHRLLGSRPDNRTRFRRNRGNRLPHDVVVIDETSMVSLTMMARLIEAVRPDARLILVGDSDQLASVDAGAVLKDLVIGLRELSDPAVSELGPTRRFGKEIGDLAEAIRDGEVETVLSLLRAGTAEVSLLEPDQLHDVLLPPALALRQACEAGDRVAAVAALDAHRLLCAHRDGPYGVAWWNRQLERWLMESTGTDWLPQWYAGQPLIVNTNDYGLDLFNGDTGVVCRDPEAPTGLLALIANGADAEGKAFSLTRMADVSTAHAMTVHRSQGSQFEEVTVLLPEPDSRVLTRELFYTAVTRAKTRVRVVATEESVRAAVARRAQRATGLAQRLGG
ncbi:MAG: exodeoxyribonuclease subunit alpha [Marmoricola sp.]|nr:exodeoxyribonuclease subunit alpha [Marmoricola sp.]